jgi:hypothetical protein
LSPDNETFVLIAIMLIPPTHVGIIPPANNTCNAQIAQLAHVIDTLLGYQAGDPVPSALADGGFTSILDVINLHDDGIDALTFPNANALPVIVPLAHRQKLRIAISMYHHWSMHLNGTVDVTTITVADYDEYRITGFHPGSSSHSQP